MNTYKWPDVSLSLTSAWSALGKPLGVKKSATTAVVITEATAQSEECRCPVWYASRHAEGAHVVPPGHNEGLDTRYSGELTA
ncbi:hypothetical protein [Nibricoccus aquaticus]|uniref:hypothetical protein n=1 Tax=Nibricoccus aquaticus TaxID=2576891 RepID=UPI0010FE5201|nr:hypothetical protein [Nibricoccus aquaticus]